MYKGSCHCGAVAYEVTGPITGFEHCHCQTCRKIHGTVYGSSAVVEHADFRVTKGRDALTDYASSPGKIRHFCSHCGSHVFATDSRDGEVLILRMGTLDPGHGLKPEAHIYVSDQADWYEIRDGLPQHGGDA